jgi:hypothetical protein
LAALNKLMGGDDMGWPFYPFESTNSCGLKVLAEKGVFRFCGNNAPPAPLPPKGNEALMAHNAMGIAFQNRMPGWTFRTILNPAQKLLHGNSWWCNPFVVFGEDYLVFVRRQGTSDNPKAKQRTNA